MSEPTYIKKRLTFDIQHLPIEPTIRRPNATEPYLVIPIKGLDYDGKHVYWPATHADYVDHVYSYEHTTMVFEVNLMEEGE